MWKTSVDAFLCSKNLKKCAIYNHFWRYHKNITLKLNTNATFSNFVRTLVKDLKIVVYLSLKPTHITFGTFIDKKDTVLFCIFFKHNLKFKYMVKWFYKKGYLKEWWITHGISKLLWTISNCYVLSFSLKVSIIEIEIMFKESWSELIIN